jgi:hypothetical protein
MPLETTLILAVGLPLLLYSFLMFDRLVKAEYAMNRIDWEADGKPRGFFWNAPECTFFRSNLARNRLSFHWLFSTPLWAMASPECQTWLRRLRICVLAWNILVVIAFLTIASR